MAVGGNGKARQFFRQHGWTETGSDKISDKYTSRAAALYRQTLARDAANYDPTNGSVTAVEGTVKLGDDAGQLSSMGFPLDSGANHQDAAEAAPLPIPQPDTSKSGSAGSIATAAAKKPVPSKSKLVLGGRKTGSKTGKKLGLVKKTEQVDSAVFSQVLFRTWRFVLC